MTKNLYAHLSLCSILEVLSELVSELSLFLLLILSLLLFIIIRVLLLAAPADSVRADNNLLSKVSQSLANDTYNDDVFLASKYQS